MRSPRRLRSPAKNKKCHMRNESRKRERLCRAEMLRDWRIRNPNTINSYCIAKGMQSHERRKRVAA